MDETGNFAEVSKCMQEKVLEKCNSKISGDSFCILVCAVCDKICDKETCKEYLLSNNLVTRMNFCLHSKHFELHEDIVSYYDVSDTFSFLKIFYYHQIAFGKPTLRTKR